jgi:hypothetical protein
MSVSDTGSMSGTPKPGTGTSGATGSGATTSQDVNIGHAGVRWINIHRIDECRIVHRVDQRRIGIWYSDIRRRGGGPATRRHRRGDEARVQIARMDLLL